MDTCIYDNILAKVIQRSSSRSYTYWKDLSTKAIIQIWKQSISDLPYYPTPPIFLLGRDIIKINILSKFGEDWIKIMVCRVGTRKLLTTHDILFCNTQKTKFTQRFIKSFHHSLPLICNEICCYTGGRVQPGYVGVGARAARQHGKGPIPPLDLQQVWVYRVSTGRWQPL